MSKGFAPILIIILIALTVGGYLLYQKQTPLRQNSVGQVKPTPESTGSAETANWKTYTNSKYGYEIQYPVNWIMYEYATTWISIQNQEDGYIAPGVFSSINTGIFSINIVDMQVLLQQIHAKMPEKQELFNPTGDFWLKISSEKSVTYSTPILETIGGKKAMKQTSSYTAENSGRPRQITVTHYLWLGNTGNEVIRILFQYVETNPNKDILLKTFDQILSTFKFTQ